MTVLKLDLWKTYRLVLLQSSLKWAKSPNKNTIYIPKYLKWPNICFATYENGSIIGIFALGVISKKNNSMFKDIIQIDVDLPPSHPIFDKFIFDKVLIVLLIDKNHDILGFEFTLSIILINNNKHCISNTSSWV